jgi:hypothetical protein
MQLLIMARSNRNADPDKDRRGCMKRGYCVATVEDRHRWGREEVRPLSQGGAFVIVSVPGLRSQDFASDFRRRFGRLPDAPLSKPSQPMLRRRAFRFDLPAGDGPHVMTIEQLYAIVVELTKERQ